MRTSPAAARALTVMDRAYTKEALRKNIQIRIAYGTGASQMGEPSNGIALQRSENEGCSTLEEEGFSFVVFLNLGYGQKSCLRHASERLVRDQHRGQLDERPETTYRPHMLRDIT